MDDILHQARWNELRNALQEWADLQSLCERNQRVDVGRLNWLRAKIQDLQA